MPPILTGPLGAVLAGPEGYSAFVSFQRAPTDLPITGQLLVRGTKFFFAPDPASLPDKLQKLAGFSFIWDTGAGKGYVLSEGLQGYSPVNLDFKATNVIAKPGGAQAGKVGGYACDSEEARVQMNDGSGAGFQVLRATAPKGLPVRVTSSDNPPMVLNLSKLRVETLRPELFEPPKSFTKYDNATVMADELVMRQRNIRRGKGPAVPSLDQ